MGVESFLILRRGGFVAVAVASDRMEDRAFGLCSARLHLRHTNGDCVDAIAALVEGCDGIERRADVRNFRWLALALPKLLRNSACSRVSLHLDGCKTVTYKFT